MLSAKQREARTSAAPLARSPTPPSPAHFPHLASLHAQVALIFDEISLVGELAFKIIKGEYVYMGMVDEMESKPLFGKRAATADEVALLKSKVATHALVFQI